MSLMWGIGTDFDRDFHRDDLSLGDVLFDHGAISRSSPLLFCSEEVSSYRDQRGLLEKSTTTYLKDA
jgi:hypothetical protein